MAMVVVDSADLNGVLADAGVEVEKPTEPTPEPKPEPKVEAKAEPEADDTEGDDGLTPRQKREFTAAMLKTVGKKHLRMREAEEFAAAQYTEKQLAEQRARDLAEENSRLKEQLQPKEVKAEAEKPARENFATDEAFQEAVDDWRVDQRFKAREAENARKAEEERQARVVEAASAQIARAKEIVPDFAEVTGGIAMTVPPIIAGAMQESEVFAELGYHFAKHPDELEELRKMSTAKALVALGKIEAKIIPFAPKAKVDNGTTPSTPTAPEPSPKTDTVPSRPRASAPITPLSNAGTAQVVKDEGAMNVREVITDWQKKNRVNLERRKRH